MGIIRYDHNGNYMMFGVNYGEKLRITSTGQVAIGTDTAETGYILTMAGDLSLGEKGGTDNTYLDQKQDGDLHIINSGRTANGASNTPGCAGVGINRYNNISGGTSLFRDFCVYNGKNSKVLYVDGSTSRVGIGTDSPTDLLTIVHSANTDDGISIVNTNNSQASAIAQLELSAGDNSHARVQFECNGKYSTIRHDGNGHLDFYTNGSNKRAAIMSSGQVNIGTGNLTQTDRMLNVYGGRLRIEGIPANSNSFEVYANSTSGQSHGMMLQAGTTNADINANFRNTSGTNLLRIRGDGVVLIGSSVVQQGSTSKLEVMGTLNNSYPGYSYPIMVSDDAAYNSSGGPGGGIGFSFKQNNGGAYAQAGGIRGIKENTTDGNYASALTFYTRANGAGTVERMRISSAGYVTTPQNPKFWYSSLSNSSSSGATSSTEILKFQTERHNQGSNYNASNGRFTAPVAGTYWFSFIGLVDNSGSSSHYWAQLWRNGSTVTSIGYTYSDNGQYNYFGGSACIYLAKDDYAQIYASANIHTGNESSFSGFLIG